LELYVIDRATGAGTESKQRENGDEIRVDDQLSDRSQKTTETVEMR